MKHASEVHFRVIDKGIFLPIARRLARGGSRVSYWTPDERAFPTVKDWIGDGFPDIERIKSPWYDSESVDCWVFPDIGFSDLQAELIRQGKIVWGARDADSLEISRGKFLSVLKSVGLPVPPYEKVVGMKALRDYLRNRKDCFVKLSRFRGDWETLHWRNQDEDELELDARTVKLGPFKDLLTFYVFDKIETEIEDGCDSYNVKGKFPSLVIHGVEAKDKAYLGTFQKFGELPEELRVVNDAFGPILAGYDYRSFFSSEVRITKEGKSYFIDPTMRAGSPPSQVLCEMIGNLPEIIWHGAQGELVEPEPAYKFGVQALVSVRDCKTWSALKLDPDLDQWFKAGFCMQIGDKLCFPPDELGTMGEMAWLIGVGNTAEESISHLKSNAEMLPCGVECHFSCISDLLKEVAEAEEQGMEFTDQPVPGPEVVLEEKQG